PANRKADGEAAAAVLVADGDVAPVGLDEAAGDGEAEAGAGVAVAGSSSCVTPERDLEDAGKIALRDPTAGVDHRHVRAAVVAAGFDGDGPVARGVPNRVFEDVAQRPQHLRRGDLELGRRAI